MTPQKSVESKVSKKRSSKAQGKYENRVKRRLEGYDTYRRFPESRSTMPRYEQGRSATKNFEHYGRQPNIHYVNSRFDRAGVVPAEPCRDSCCVSPSNIAGVAGGKPLSRSRSRQRKSSSLFRDSTPKQKTGKVNGKTPETFYINTITNNYYQIRRKNG